MIVTTTTAAVCFGGGGYPGWAIAVFARDWCADTARQLSGGVISTGGDSTFCELVSCSTSTARRGVQHLGHL